jgi:hypothetical protein
MCCSAQPNDEGRDDAARVGAPNTVTDVAGVCTQVAPELGIYPASVSHPVNTWGSESVFRLIGQRETRSFVALGSGQCECFIVGKKLWDRRF